MSLEQTYRFIGGMDFISLNTTCKMCGISSSICNCNFPNFHIKPQSVSFTDRLRELRQERKIDPATANAFFGCSQVLHEDNACICGKTDKLMKCSKCHSKSYCSKECQRKDWINHKKHCL